MPRRQELAKQLLVGLQIRDARLWPLDIDRCAAAHNDMSAERNSILATEGSKAFVLYDFFELDAGLDRIPREITEAAVVVPEKPHRTFRNCLQSGVWQQHLARGPGSILMLETSPIVTKAEHEDHGFFGWLLVLRTIIRLGVPNPLGVVEGLPVEEVSTKVLNISNFRKMVLNAVSMQSTR